MKQHHNPKLVTTLESSLPWKEACIYLGTSWMFFSTRTVYFQPSMWEPMQLPLGEIRLIAGWSVRVPVKCSPLKGGNSLQGLSNSHGVHFGITNRIQLMQK